MIGRQESRGLDRRTGGLGLEWHRPPLDSRPGARHVDDNAEHPGSERRAALEAIERAQHRQPRLLHDLFGDGAVRDVRQRESEHQAAPAVHELAEHLLLAAPERRHERHIVEHGSTLACQPAEKRPQAFFWR
jgi:hypothetical protein